MNCAFYIFHFGVLIHSLHGTGLVSFLNNKTKIIYFRDTFNYISSIKHV